MEKHVGVAPDEGHKDDWRDGTLILREMVESVWAVKSGGEKSPISYCSLPVLKGGLKQRWGKLIGRSFCNKTKDNVFKLNEGRCRLDIRSSFFPMKVVKHWIRFSRNMVDAPSLETFTVRLDRVLINLV